MFEIWFYMPNSWQRFVVRVQGIEEAEAMWDLLSETFVMISEKP